MTGAGPLALLFAALVACKPRAPDPTAAAALQGVVDLEGAPFDPFAEAMGRPFVLAFVGTACPISNRYAPTLRELGAAWTEADVRAWLVYPDPGDDAAAVRAHLGTYDLGLPALRDPEHALVARAEVRVTPEAAVFSAGASSPAYHGRIDDRAVDFGRMRAEASHHDLRDAVEAVRRGETPASPAATAVGCYISDLR